MPKILKLKKSMLVLTTALAGGTMFSDGCMNLAASLPVCGTVLTFCTPVDQLNLMFPLLETPDFNADPSCTIPLGCSTSDLYGNTANGLPGGGPTEPPSDEQTGTGAGGGGGV